MKKSKFWTFMLSFIPGCGHMYLGYMKKGTQFMALFIGAIVGVFAALDFLYMDMAATLFALTMPLIWFYQFFDAMHTINRMRKLGLEEPDEDALINLSGLDSVISAIARLFNSKLIAALLLVFGGLILFQSLSQYFANYLHLYIIREVQGFISRYLVSTLISLGLIVAGFRLLIGKKKPAENDDNNSGEGF